MVLQCAAQCAELLHTTVQHCCCVLSTTVHVLPSGSSWYVQPSPDDSIETMMPFDVNKVLRTGNSDIWVNALVWLLHVTAEKHGNVQYGTALHCTALNCAALRCV